MPVPAGDGGVGWPPVTAGLTLAYDGVLSRVRIGAVGVPGAAATVDVERSTDQVRWTTVRGGLSLTPVAGAVMVDDYEFAAGVPNFYRVRAFTADGREIGPTLNVNPFLEVDAAGWELQGSTIARSTGQAHQGAASLQIVPNGSSAAGGAISLAARVPVIAGEDYLMGLWALTTQSTSIGPAVDWWSATSGGVALANSFAQATVLAGAWVYRSATVTAPPTSAAAAMRARHDGTPPSSAVWYADEIQLNQLDVGPMFAGSIVPALDGVWLKSIARPFLNREVVVRDFGEVTRPSRSGIHDVVGRSDPVAVTDVRGSRQWQLLLNTYNQEEADDLDLLLASGDILLVHVPPNAGRISAVPGGYVVVGDSREMTPPTLDLAARVFELPCKQVAAPGPDVVGSTSNWQTVLNTYATWADLLAAHPSWASVLELVGDPEDVIVS